MSKEELIQFIRDNLTIDLSEKRSDHYYGSNKSVQVTATIFFADQKISSSDCWIDIT